jgi:hypothetical protein
VYLQALNLVVYYIRFPYEDTENEDIEYGPCQLQDQVSHYASITKELHFLRACIPMGMEDLLLLSVQNRCLALY